MMRRALIIIQLVIFLCPLLYVMDDSGPRSLARDREDPLEFSVERALTHLREIAREPHYIGTEEHKRVREYLLAQLLAMGVEAEISEHHLPGELRLGSSNFRVFNVLGRLEGSGDSDQALLIASHYDSVPIAPGAADDGAAVASMLETLRALKAGPRPKNDIIFLFTDAEEVCLCGAKAFSEEHRWAKDVGVVINFEGRGASGSSVMFETSDGNAKLISALSQFTARPSTNSLTYEVYKRLPNDTDMTMFRKGGMPGLNFAFIGNLKYYHSPEDTVENLSRASLGHHGTQMLSAARYFGDSKLDDFAELSGNSVYFDFANLFVIRYPEKLAPLIGCLVFGLWLASLVLGMAKGRFTAGGMGLQVLLTFILTFFCIAIAWASSGLYEQFFYKLVGVPRVTVLTSKPAFLALLLLVLSVFVLIFRRWISYGRWFPASGFWLAFLALVVPFAMPGASYLFAWPLLFLSVAQMWQYAAGEKASAPVASIVTALCMIPGIVILGTTLNGVFTAMTLRMFWAEIFVALLLFMPLLAQWMHTREAKAAN